MQMLDKKAEILWGGSVARIARSAMLSLASTRDLPPLTCSKSKFVFLFVIQILTNTK